MNKSLSLFGINEDHLTEYEKQLWEPNTLSAYKDLKARAIKEGIGLSAVSVFRSFHAQLKIWNLKCDGKRPVLNSSSKPIDIKVLSVEELIFSILRWSALPGLSRHHWGTDFDIIDICALEKKPEYVVQLTPDEYRKGGIFENLGVFLEHNLGETDLFRPYEIDLGGVAPEPWHLSFRPKAQELLRKLTIDKLLEFCGSDYFKQCYYHEVIIVNIEKIYEQYFLAISD